MFRNFILFSIPILLNAFAFDDDDGFPRFFRSVNIPRPGDTGVRNPPPRPEIEHPMTPIDPRIIIDPPRPPPPQPQPRPKPYKTRRCAKNTLDLGDETCLLKTGFVGTFAEGEGFCNKIGGVLPYAFRDVDRKVHSSLMGPGFWTQGVAFKNDKFHDLEGKEVSSRIFGNELARAEDGQPICTQSKGLYISRILLFRHRLPLSHIQKKCDERLPVHCLVAPEEPQCAPGWSYNRDTDKCYNHIRQEVSLFEANALCHLNDADLVSIHDDAENSFVANLIPDGLEAWIGLVAVPGAGPKSTLRTSFPVEPPRIAREVLEWLDDSKVDYLGWQRWENSQLRALDKDDVRNCFYLENSKSDNNVNWNNRACQRKASGFVCAKPIRPSTVLSLLETVKQEAKH